jgi:hypothetical protein
MLSTRSQGCKNFRNSLAVLLDRNRLRLVSRIWKVNFSTDNVIMIACIMKAKTRGQNYCLTDGQRSDLLSRRLTLSELPDGGEEEYMYDQLGEPGAAGEC